MTNLDNAKAQLHADLGYKPLNKIWAKAEILLGLLAVAVSISWMIHEVVHDEVWVKTGRYPGMGLVLFILGAYLALAGHRSHIYQTLNDHTAYLLEQIRQLKDKGQST